MRSFFRKEIMKTYYSKQIVSHQGIIEGYINIDQGKIVGLERGKPNGDFIDLSEQVIYPGFLDIHVHGWGTGSYALENTVASIEAMSFDMAKEGVTGFLATTMTDSLAQTQRYIETGNQAYHKPMKGAHFLGLHLEGPFINPKQKGMQKEAHCLTPDLDIMKSLYHLQTDKSMIKLMTMAPELDPSMQVIQFCQAHNIQVSAGHTEIGLEDLAKMKDYGVGGMTHMFSGMKGFHHRDLGSVGAALYCDDIYCEFAKQTGITVKHEAFDLVYRLKGPDKIFMTTDCLGLAKVQKPTYHYVRQVTFVPHDEYLLLKHDDGKEEKIYFDDYQAIRQVELSYIDSIKNMCKHTAVSPMAIAKMCSQNPAEYIHLGKQKGKIMCGYDADLTILDKEMNVFATMVAGTMVYQR